MGSDKKIRVGIVGLGFGAEFIPIYQQHPNAEMYAICRRNKAELDACRRPVRRQGALHRLRRDARRPQPRRRARQLADCGPRAAVDCRAEGRQARRQHGPRRDDGGRVPADRRRAAQVRQGLHDDGDRRLQPRIPLRQGAVRHRRARTHPVPPRQPPAGHGRAGPDTGKGFRRCTTRRTASARASRSSASTPSTSSATARDGSTRRSSRSTAARSRSRPRPSSCATPMSAPK